MRLHLLFLTFMLIAASGFSQAKTVLALPVHYEPDPIADGDILLLVQKPKSITLKEGQTFVCKGIYRTGSSDTATIGEGYLRSILSNDLECIMPAKSLKGNPKNGDLCYFLIPENTSRTDLFYKPARYAISFNTVEGKTLFDPSESLGSWTSERSTQLLGQMAEDIRYTGKAMKEQNDTQQQQIKDGPYAGQMLFDAMAKVQPKEVEAFMKFVNDRPALYAGGHWSIAEVFATWMTK